MINQNLLKDPQIQKLGTICGLTGEICRLIEERDRKVYDQLRPDLQGAPLVLVPSISSQDRQSIVDAINFRISMIQQLSQELVQIDLNTYNNIGIAQPVTPPSPAPGVEGGSEPLVGG
jgi:hypothetical protein